jgi:hypothetical protein
MMTRSDSEWDQRILCSDGNCIGIIGADGRCKACGMPYDGDLPLPEADTDAPEDAEAVAPDDAQMTEIVDPIDDDRKVATATPDDSWENRTLCIDETCIGVVGPDGRCKECGKPHPG